MITATGKIDCPKASGRITGTKKDGTIGVRDGHLMRVKEGGAAVVAKLTNGQERASGKSRKDMTTGGCRGKARNAELGEMTGKNMGTTGKSDP